MEARMKNPAAVLPGAWQAVVELNKASDSGGVPADTMEIVHLRVSQINGCSACVASAAKSKQSPERLATVAAWRESPYFTDAERAALALAEAATRLADSTDPVPDAIWDEATTYYDEQGMAALILKIAVTNVFNRLNRVTPAGAWCLVIDAGNPQIKTRIFPNGFVLRASLTVAAPTWGSAGLPGICPRFPHDCRIYFVHFALPGSTSEGRSDICPHRRRSV